MPFKSISIIGLGYIGLPTAAVLASRMGNVVGVDVNREVVEAVNAATVRTVEPGLAELLAEVTAKGRLRAVANPEAADAFIIAVPTPITEDHKPDISHVRAAALSLAPVLRAGNLIILESTSPVGTTEQMAQWLAQARPDLSFPQPGGEKADVQIAYCPERILPGNMLEELVHNDRVIGGMNTKAAHMAACLYKIFVKGNITVTNCRTAELCKLTENSFRDINIAFSNAISMICNKMDVDVWELIALANHHPRVNILNPGCGVGGHCIAIDPWFIVSGAPKEASLLRRARELNIYKTKWTLQKIDKCISEVLTTGLKRDNITIVCLGLAYKPNVGDLRESPALAIVENLASRYQGRVIVVEPNITKLPEILLHYKVTMMNLEEALAQATIVVALIDHNLFRSISFEKYRRTQFVDMIGIRK